MELYACGFNAHRQLIRKSEHGQDDLLRFESILRAPKINVRCVLWSATIIESESDGSLIYRGFRESGTTPVAFSGPPSRNIRSLFGDEIRLLGGLGTDGSLYLFVDDAKSLGRGPELKKRSFSDGNSLQKRGLAIEHVAISGGGEVCVCINHSITKRVPSGCTPPIPDSTPHIDLSTPTPEVQLLIFTDFSHFLSFEEPNQRYILTTPLRQLIASATTFTALTATGEVLTFGSALHMGALGRPHAEKSPAFTPCPIPFLGGIPIRKISSSGWITAAISEDQDLYIWGGRASDPKRINALPKPHEELVKLVDIKGGVDVVDVGVGSGHVIALTGEGEVWVTGDGEYGQLGIGTEFKAGWVLLEGNWQGKAIEVGCGLWNSWLLINTGVDIPEG